MQTTTRVSLRRVPADLLSQIDDLAAQENRGREGEILNALQEHLKRRSPSHISSALQRDRMELSKRLNWALEYVHDAPPSREWNQRQLALQAGLEARVVVGAFSGETDTSFDDIFRLSDTLCIDRKWLSTGIGNAINTRSFTIFGNAPEVVERLLEPHDRWGKPHNLDLIRTTDKDGSFYIVRDFSKNTNIPAFEFLYTNILLSEEGGGGNWRNLKTVFSALKLLYSKYIHCKIDDDIAVFGHLLSNETITEYKKGHRHPLELVYRRPGIGWWEDIWDTSQNYNHWPGLIPWRNKVLQSMKDQ